MAGTTRSATVRVLSLALSVIFGISNSGWAAVASNLRPRSAASNPTQFTLESDLSGNKDGGIIAGLLSNHYVNGGQQAVTSLIRYRDTQYLNAVGAKGSAKLFRAFKPGEFIDGDELYKGLEKAGKATIAVNVVSYNEIEGHLRAAMENDAAIILEVARSQIGYAIDEVKFTEYVREIQAKLNCAIPICLHLDHNQYDQALFDQKKILKAAYEEVHGAGSFKDDTDVNTIEDSILRKAQDTLRENAEKERKVVASITDRCLRVGFTSIAIDASTIFDELAGDLVSRYYAREGTAEEKLVLQLEESFALPLEFGAEFLKFDSVTQKAEFDRVKNEVVSEMTKRNRPQEEINAKVKDVEAAFGVLVSEARKAGLNPQSVIAAYDRIMKDIAQATIAGRISGRIMATISEKEKLLLLPTNNVAETVHQLKFADDTSRKYNPKARIGKEAEVGHVDKKVPNPRRNGALEAKMTHPVAISVMEELLGQANVIFHIVAFNNGSGHGTDYDKKNLVPVSQVGKISPYLTAEIKKSSTRAVPAQHGTSGSDMDELSVLAKAGVVKFNIATNNQQIQLNVHYLMQAGLRGALLMQEIEANPGKYVNGLTEDVRAAIKQAAADLKEGRIKETIEDSDNSFIRFMKLTYTWGKKKGKIKDSSSKEDVSVVLAKEFKRGFKDMDPFLAAMGQLKLVTRIAILTSGGPASGHNNVIYSALKEAKAQGIELYVIWEGWKGLMKDALVAQARPLTLEEVEPQRLQGGTMLLTSRENPYSAENLAAGMPARVMENIKKLGLDGLITLGGDDTNSVSYKLQNDYPDFPIIGGAKTMDGDIALEIAGAPNYGHSTFVNKAIEMIKLGLVDYKSTKRIGVVEVFGRSAGFVTARVGAALTAARSLIPEETVDLEQLIKDIKAYQAKNGYGVVIVSEGVKIDPKVGKNAEILAAALAKDDRATAAFEGTNVKRDPFGNPKLEDAAAIISAVLKYGGISTSLTGKIDYLARSVPVDEFDEKITSLIGRTAVNKIATGEKDQLVYVDSDNLETMQPVSMRFTAKLGGRKMDISENGADRAVYRQANQALGMADGGTVSDTKQTFQGLTELYKAMCWTHWDLYSRMQQPEFITMTPEQMQAWVSTLATYKEDEDFMWLRRIVRKTSPEQVAELKAMCRAAGLQEAMELTLKDINMFVIAANGRIFRAGAFADFVRNQEAGVNIVGIKSAKGKQELSAKDFVQHNSYLNKLFIGFKVIGMRMFPDQPATIGGLQTPAIRIPADRNVYRPEMVVPYFEASVSKEDEAKGKKAYDTDEILEAYAREGISVDVVLDYGGADEKQIIRMRPFAKRHIPMVLASPANKDGIRALLAEYGRTSKNALVESLYGFNRHIVTNEVEAVDSLTCTSNAMLNILMAVLTNPLIEAQNIWGKTWHSATDSNSIFSEASGRARQLIDWLRGISILDNYIPAGTGAAKNLQVVIDSLGEGNFDEIVSNTMIDAARTGTFVGSQYEIVISLKKPITQEQAEKMLRDFANNRSDGMVKYYEGVPGESETPLDLNKIAGMPEVSIIDGLQLKVSKNGLMLTINGFYDNQLAAPGQMAIRWAARMIDARRAKQAIAARQAVTADGGVTFVAQQSDHAVYAKFATPFIDFVNAAASVKVPGGGLVFSAKTILQNAGSVATLTALKRANLALDVVVWAENDDQIQALKRLGVDKVAALELRTLPEIVTSLNAKGVESQRIVLINSGTVAENSALVKDVGIKAVAVAAPASSGLAVNSMPLAVAKAIAMAESDEAVNEKFMKVAQEYKLTVSESGFSKLEDLTSAVAEVPLVSVDRQVAQDQAAYEEAVSRI